MASQSGLAHQLDLRRIHLAGQHLDYWAHYRLLAPETIAVTVSGEQLDAAAAAAHVEATAADWLMSETSVNGTDPLSGANPD